MRSKHCICEFPVRVGLALRRNINMGGLYMYVVCISHVLNEFECSDVIEIRNGMALNNDSLHWLPCIPYLV